MNNLQVKTDLNRITHSNDIKNILPGVDAILEKNEQ